MRLPTPWNQIEAAMAYSRRQPLMVIVEESLAHQGLLAYGHNWYVQDVRPEPESLNTPEFNGVFASWKSKIIEFSQKSNETDGVTVDPEKWTLIQVIQRLKLTAIYGLLAGLVAFTAGVFALGTKVAAIAHASNTPPATDGRWPSVKTVPSFLARLDQLSSEDARVLRAVAGTNQFGLYSDQLSAAAGMPVDQLELRCKNLQTEGLVEARFLTKPNFRLHPDVLKLGVRPGFIGCYLQ
jgi:hypothetical protein